MCTPRTVEQYLQQSGERIESKSRTASTRRERGGKEERKLKNNGTGRLAPTWVSIVMRWLASCAHWARAAPSIRENESKLNGQVSPQCSSQRRGLGIVHFRKNSTACDKGLTASLDSDLDVDARDILRGLKHQERSNMGCLVIRVASIHCESLKNSRLKDMFDCLEEEHRATISDSGSRAPQFECAFGVTLWNSSSGPPTRRGGAVKQRACAR